MLGEKGPVIAFLFTAILSFINFFMILFMYRDTAPKSAVEKFHFNQGIINIKETLLLKSSRIFFAIYFFWSLGWVMAVQWFPAYSIEVFGVSVIDFTTWYILMGITWTLGAFFARNYLINRYSTMTIGILGFSVMTACLFLMQFMSIFTVFSIIFAIASFFAVFSMSSSVNLISMSASKEVQGKLMGLTQSAQSIAFVFVSLIAFLVSLFTISILFYFSAGIAALALVLLLYKNMSNRRIEKQ